MNVRILIALLLASLWFDATGWAAPSHGQGMDCGACHREDSWAMRGDGGGFDHAQTGFPLVGAHAAASCERCHQAQRATKPNCGACHVDPHAGRQGAGCEHCHRTTSWRDTAALEAHRRTRLPLTGRHAIVECVSCHPTDTAGSWRRVPADCYGCHRQDYHRERHPDHDGDAAQPNQPMLARQCELCHRATGWRPAVVVPSQLRQALQASAVAHVAFPLRGAHQQAACTTCHVSRARPRATRCDACHDGAALREAHRGQPVPVVGSNCLRCHARGGRP